MLDAIKENMIILLLFVTMENKSKDNTETKTEKENTTTKAHSLALTFPVLSPSLKSPPLTKILMVL